MPLRDHFRPPLDELRHWEGFHATWPVMIVAQLRRELPKRYFAEPRVHSGASAEIDVTTYESERDGDIHAAHENGGVATAVWAPPRAKLAVTTDLPKQHVYEVLVYDEKHRCRLVAAVEIVSPGNKDRPEHRQAFVAKCVALLRAGVAVVIVDVVTTRHANLYADLLTALGQSDPSLGPEPPPIYGAACRLTKRQDEWLLETWPHALSVGQPLPVLSLWLADNLAVPLDLEESYELGCQLLGIP